MSEQLHLLRRLSKLHQATLEDRAFVVSARNSIAAGDTLNLHIANPADSETTLEMMTYHPETTFLAQWAVYDQLGDSVSGGTDLTPDSLLMDSASETPTETVATTTQDVTFDDTNDPHIQSVVPSGGVGGNTRGGRGHGTEPNIEPGREIVVQVTNDSDSERTGAIVCVFIEADRVASQE